MLAHFNTQWNDDKTVRFRNNEIDVYFAVNQNLTSSAKRELERWSNATNDLITFNYVDSPPDNGLSVLPFPLIRPAVCGSASPDHENGVIKRSVIFLDAISLTTLCEKTLTHEVGHAIGLMAHSDDGGLMDDNGGDGKINDQIVRILKIIYSTPPDTPFSSIEFDE